VGKANPNSETMAEQHFSFPHKSSPRSDPLAFWRVYTPHRCKILKLPPSVALFHFPLSALNSLYAAPGAEFLCDSSSRNPLRISLKKQGDCAANCDRSAIPPDLSVERGNLIGAQPSPCATTGEPGGVKIPACRGEGCHLCAPPPLHWGRSELDFSAIGPRSGRGAPCFFS
jgi:hypothetical protein